MLSRSAALALLLACSTSAQPGGRAALAEPSLAPDLQEIVFVSGGDVWTAPLAGGEARLLVSHSANEQRPRITDSEGRNTELNSRPVDVQVKRPIGRSYSEVDWQLDASVRELLKQQRPAATN